jgi:hypothetical protein
MDEANGSRECAPDDKLRYTHRLPFAQVMSFASIAASSGVVPALSRDP